MRPTCLDGATPDDLAVSNLTALPDDGGAWLIFDPPTGRVDRYELKMGDGPWQVVATRPRPVYLDDLTNGERIELQLRAVRDERSGQSAGPVTVTPTEATPPDVRITVTKAGEPTPSASRGERVTIEVDLTIENLGATVLPHLWLHPRFDPSMRATLTDAPSGTLFATPGGWYWRDANLAPGQPVTIPLTLAWEVQP